MCIRDRSWLDKISFHQNLGQSIESLPENDISLKQAQAFRTFIEDISVMLRQRGLTLPGSQAPTFKLGQKLNYWLPNACLGQSLAGKESDVRIDWGILDPSSAAFTSLVNKNQRLGKWLKSVVEVLERAPIKDTQVFLSSNSKSCP
eukprot:TRINITY_DN24176_c0_g1_i1.p1 TRINITY_DN24176_c0_g1~~TRINITY_DN24176_c0_g1_i1.p1  ORF type:complete len:166 (-),score=24.92 TRINITY_DN24176_c0_g1_i1:71-508(-)